MMALLKNAGHVTGSVQQNFNRCSKCEGTILCPLPKFLILFVRKKKIKNVNLIPSLEILCNVHFLLVGKAQHC